MTTPTAKQILHEVFGYPEFRGNQEAVVNTLAKGESLLVLMPTGGGKSLCYQIPALMREGVAIVVSPLTKSPVYMRRESKPHVSIAVLPPKKRVKWRKNWHKAV